MTKRLITKIRASLRHDLPIIGHWTGEVLCWVGALMMTPGSLLWSLGATIQEWAEDAE